MSQFVDTGTRTFIAGGAIGADLRVKLTSGKLAVAAVADKELGTLRDAAYADGDQRAVILRNKPGTFIGVANGVVAVGADVYTAASGKYSATAATGARLVGQALTASGADGDRFEILRHEHGEASAP